MNSSTSAPHPKTGYDIIHFEALGTEASHLETETIKAVEQHLLPASHSYLITPDSQQNFMAQNPAIVLPDLLSIKTHSVVPASYLNNGRKSIITRSAGYDHVEQLIEQVNIASLREYCVMAVAQTALKFVYACAGLLNHYERNCTTFERNQSRPFMELGRQRTLTVFGVGNIGKCIHDLAAANGLTVRGVDIRHEELDRRYNGKVRFISRDEAVATSDIMVNAMNLTKDRKSRYHNSGYFSEEYLAGAAKELIFINVTRGEIAPEEVLLKLYDAGKIIGVGLDVFSDESECARALNGAAGYGNSFSAARELIGRSVNRSANIYVQPHQGFNSDGR